MHLCWIHCKLLKLFSFMSSVCRTHPEAEFMNVQFWWGFWEFWGFCLGFLKPKGRGYGFLSGFPNFSFTVYSNWTVKTVRGCMSFEEIEISRQSCRGDCEARRKRKLLRLLLGFRPRIRPLGGFYYITPRFGLSQSIFVFVLLCPLIFIGPLFLACPLVL